MTVKLVYFDGRVIEHVLKQPFPGKDMAPGRIKLAADSQWFEYDENADAYLEVVDGVQ